MCCLYLWQKLCLLFALCWLHELRWWQGGCSWGRRPKCLFSRYSNDTQHGTVRLMVWRWKFKGLIAAGVSFALRAKGGVYGLYVRSLQNILELWTQECINTSLFNSLCTLDWTEEELVQVLLIVLLEACISVILATNEINLMVWVLSSNEPHGKQWQQEHFFFSFWTHVECPRSAHHIFFVLVSSLCSWHQEQNCCWTRSRIVF